MVNNDWLHIKTLLNFIQHGTSIGPGSRVGGSNSHTSPAQLLMCFSLYSTLLFSRNIFLRQMLVNHFVTFLTRLFIEGIFADNLDFIRN